MSVGLWTGSACLHGKEKNEFCEVWCIWARISLIVKQLYFPYSVEEKRSSDGQFVRGNMPSFRASAIQNKVNPALASWGHTLPVPKAASELSHCRLNKHTKSDQKANTRPLLTKVCIYRNPVTERNLNLDSLETTQSTFPKFTLIVQQIPGPGAPPALWWSLKQELMHQKSS